MSTRPCMQASIPARVPDPNGIPGSWPSATGMAEHQGRVSSACPGPYRGHSRVLGHGVSPSAHLCGHADVDSDMSTRCEHSAMHAGEYASPRASPNGILGSWPSGNDIAVAHQPPGPVKAHVRCRFIWAPRAMAIRVGCRLAIQRIANTESSLAGITACEDPGLQPAISSPPESVFCFAYWDSLGDRKLSRANIMLR